MSGALRCAASGRGTGAASHRVGGEDGIGMSVRSVGCSQGSSALSM